MEAQKVQLESTAPVSSNTFAKRVEKKFIVPGSAIKELLLDKEGDFAQMFQFDYIYPDHMFNMIENIHFDNDQMDSYHDSINKSPERHKLRVRYYSPNGLPDEKLYFEIKSKEGEATIKSRVALKSRWLNPFLFDGSIPEEDFLLLNSGMSMKKISKTIARLRYFVLEKKYHPVLRSSYMRYAFKLKNSNDVRVTFDTDLTFTKIYSSRSPDLPYDKGIDKDDVIVEVKVSDVKYENLISFFEDKFTPIMSKDPGFSKYCFGIFKTKNVFPMNDGGDLASFVSMYSSKSLQ